MRQADLPTDRERIETGIIKSLIESYFIIVRKNFTDLVPKTVMYFLVNHARDSMQVWVSNNAFSIDHNYKFLYEHAELCIGANLFLFIYIRMSSCRNFIARIT